MTFPRAVGVVEQMDDAGLDPGTYALVLRDLARVNRATLAHRATLRFVARAAMRGGGFSLLDVGFGAGDGLRAVARWARRHRVPVRLVGVDLNAASAPVAAAMTDPELPIEYRTGDYADQPERFDLVVSSLVAHHMAEDELVRFLRFMEARAARGWLVNDLHRTRFAHRGYPLLARLAGWHRIVREDGTLSIARSFRGPEWQALLAKAGIADARVRRVFPSRLCVERLR